MPLVIVPPKTFLLMTLGNGARAPPASHTAPRTPTPERDGHLKVTRTPGGDIQPLQV